MRTKIKRIVAVLATTSICGCMPLNYPLGTFDIKLHTKATNSSVVIDETNFPHPVFRKYVCDNFDSNDDGFLSAGEIEEVGSLEIESSGISDLSGIEYFTNLSELNCSYNRLTSLDVSKNTSLNVLNCNKNQLTSLDVSANTRLSKLYCSGNELAHLDLSKNTSLIELDCNNNQLTSLDPSKNTSLIELDCDNNQLTSLDLSKNTSLIELDCNNNQLTSLDLSKNTSLIELTCIKNQLTSLDLSTNISLTKLTCDNNQLTSLDLSKNTSLIELNCNYNQLTSLDLSKNTSLIELNCNNNKLTSLDVSNTKWLDSLYCSDNQLTSLDISHNMALMVLQCMNNQITNLDVSKNKDLVALFCGNNQLTNLDVSNNTSLRSVNCDNNHLTSLDLSNNTALSGLGCSGNQLTVLNLSNNKELFEFGCSNNYLTTLDLSNNPKLEYLYCSGNRLTSLDLPNTSRYIRFECADNVYEINLTGNTFDLSTLPKGFDVTKTSDWRNASIDGNILNFNRYSYNDGKITYVYDHGNGYNSMFTLVVIPTQLEENMVQKIETQTYTGKAIRPVELFHNDYKLIEGIDYTISYENNMYAGTASYTITGSDIFDGKTIGAYTGELTGEFTIEKATPEIIPVIPDIEYYTGAELPEITVKSEIDGNIKWTTELVNGLNEGENELEWQFIPNDSNNYNVVTGTIIVTAKTLTISIQPSGETIIDSEKLENPEEGDELFVEAGSVQAVFDYNAMIEIEHNHGNKEIKFSYKVVEKEEIEENDAIREAIMDSDQLFEFDLSDSNGNKVEFSSNSNNGIVTITIPYTKPVSANEVNVYYISPTGEKIDMNGKYNPSTKTITFDTTHFSYYSIVAEYEKETTTTITTTSTTTSTATTSTTTSDTASSTTTTASTNYIDADKLCDWAVNDYKKKTNATHANAVIKYNEDDTAVITLTDAEGNILDVYTINLITGKGTENDGEEVNLPQTGYSVSFNIIMYASMTMIFLGIYIMAKSRKQNEE